MNRDQENQIPDDLPNMTIEENPNSVGGKGRQKQEKNDFRGREKNSTGSYDENGDENEGLPSVNRKKGGNRLLTTGGFIFIIGLGLLLIFAVNKPKEQKANQNEQNQNAGNKMPPLVLPPPDKPKQEQTFFVPPPPPQKPQATRQSNPNERHVMTWEERKMGGTILINNQNQGSSQAQPTPTTVKTESSDTGFGEPSRQKQTPLGANLESTATKTVSASILKNRDFLITKGTSLDCALNTAVDSSLPGITTCTLTRDIYSDNGRVLLLGRGSKLVGEYQGGVKQGQYRIFALWSRVETPDGVVINLNSPGTDALGRSGLTGFVDNHFWKRFGSAILMSFINSGSQALANSTTSGGSGTNNFYGDAANSGNKIIEKILDSTVNIPPTIIINQGAHIQVMVARDLDFSSVYSLKAKAAQ